MKSPTRKYGFPLKEAARRVASLKIASAARLANGYEEDLRRAHENIQHLERAVADLEHKLGAHEHEEAGSRKGFQTGGRAWGCGEGGAGAQRDDAGQCQPEHAQNGGGDPAQVEDELSTMS